MIEIKIRIISKKKPSLPIDCICEKCYYVYNGVTNSQLELLPCFNCGNIGRYNEI